MRAVLVALFAALRDAIRRRSDLELELLALRHQVLVLQRQHGRRQLRLGSADRLLWIGLSRFWSRWREALMLVKPETVIAWHRRGFRLFWRWKSRGRPPGRPTVPREVIDLIHTMQKANPTWGAPRIHGELLKLGIDVAQSTVSKYLLRSKRPPSQGWERAADRRGTLVDANRSFRHPRSRWHLRRDIPETHRASRA